MICEQNGLVFESLEILHVPRVFHAFCSRRGGVSKGIYESLNLGLRTADDPEAVKQNDRILHTALDIPGLVRARQVHGHDVHVIRERVAPGTHFLSLERDALITDQPGVALAVLTADCLPIALYDPKKNAIGMVHAGWRGTCRRAASFTVSAMTEYFGSDPRDIVSGLGPCIRQCCYEVDHPVYNAAGAEFGDVAESFFISRGPGKYFFDLSAANKETLIQAGILPEHIQTSSRCTACHPELFFSHRRDGAGTGREINLIMLRP